MLLLYQLSRSCRYMWAFVRITGDLPCQKRRPRISRRFFWAAQHKECGELFHALGGIPWNTVFDVVNLDRCDDPFTQWHRGRKYIN